jgi:putative transcriptional regulator
MGKKAFDSIAAGLRAAIEYAKGDKTKGRLHRVYVPQVDVGTVRANLGLSQGEFAAAFGVSVGTVRNWEQGRRRPEGPARVLLAVIDKAPKSVLDTLGVARTRRKAPVAVGVPRSGRKAAA